MPSIPRRSVGILSIGVPYFDATAKRRLAATRQLLEPRSRSLGRVRQHCQAGRSCSQRSMKE